MTAAVTSFLIALVFSFLTMPHFANLGSKFRIVDTPDARKTHTGSIPLVGGICIFFAIATALMIQGFYNNYLILMSLSFVLLLLGLIDDIYNLSAIFRLAFQVIVAFAMVVFGDVAIVSVGELLPGQQTQFGLSFSLVFTVICVIGVINAINMIDGMDGLSGSILLISFFSLFLLAMSQGKVEQMGFLAAVVGALAGFLYFNSQFFRAKALVFLGDSGSTFLGLTLVWFFVLFTQGEGAPLSPVSAGWIFGLPLADTISVTVGRILKGKSPFEADRDHFHHLLLDNGISTQKTLLVIVLLHTLLVSVGIAFNESAAYEPYLFWGFVVIVIAHFFLTRIIVSKIVGLSAS